jgi:thiol-disulfide isomerase/thioredoxin
MSPRFYPRLAVAAAAAAGALLLLALGLEYRLHAPSGEGAVFQLSQSSGAGGALRLSVFDQPRVLPEIGFTDGKGHALKLTDFRGKAVLLNIWATWCAPCREEMPALDRLQAKLGGENFVVLPLSIDRGGVAAVEHFYRELGIEKLGIYVDASGQTSRTLGLQGVPTTLLIDREGREVARKMGPAEWDGAQMVALVEKTIRGASSGEPDRNR